MENPQRMLMADAVERVVGTRPTPAVLLSWRRNGVKLSDGSRLRLRGIKCGGAWYCEIQDVQAFVNKQTEAALQSSEVTNA